MRYLRGTSNYKICFNGQNPMLVGYTYVDMVGDIDNRKSTSRYLFTFARGAIAW